MGSSPLIVYIKVAPAVELENERYTESHRDQFELGKKVKRILDRELEALKNYG